MACTQPAAGRRVGLGRFRHGGRESCAARVPARRIGSGDSWPILRPVPPLAFPRWRVASRGHALGTSPYFRGTGGVGPRGRRPRAGWHGNPRGRMADHFHHFTNPSGVSSSADFEGFDRAETFDLAEPVLGLGGSDARTADGGWIGSALAAVRVGLRRLTVRFSDAAFRNAGGGAAETSTAAGAAGAGLIVAGTVNRSANARPSGRSACAVGRACS